MSKYDYLHALYQALLSLDAPLRNTIMREIEDQFRTAEENGLSEIDVTNTLGTPSEYAAKVIQLQTDKQQLQADKQQLATENNDIDLNTTSLQTFEHTTIAGIDLSLLSKTLSVPSILDESKVATPEIDIPKLETNNTVITPKSSELTTRPVSIAQQTNNSTYLNRTQSTKLNVKNANAPLTMILIAFGMILFNSIFVIGPFVALWGSIFAFVTTGVAITLSGLLIILSGIFTIPLSFISVPLVIMGHPVLLFSFGFLIVGLGGLLTVLMIYSIRFFGLLTGKYIGWNFKLIRGY